jgi:hypothetical protein
MSDEVARVLARSGNVAVTRLDGRVFPGVHIQGDTFAGLHRQLADGLGRLHRTATDAGALDDLDHAVAEMTQILRFYETVLDENHIERPYYPG